MAYDEELADRVRAVLPADGRVDERKMFGGLAFMFNGHMFCGIFKEALMLRLSPERAERALHESHVRPMAFTGQRPMHGMILVDLPGLLGSALSEWVEEAAALVRARPPKPPK